VTTFVAMDSSMAFTGRMSTAVTGIGKGNREDLSDMIYMIDPTRLWSTNVV